MSKITSLTPFPEELEKFFCKKAKEFFHIQPERSKREDTYLYEEFGCNTPIRFNTSEGTKTMQPGKAYDRNLNIIGDAVL